MDAIFDATDVETEEPPPLLVAYATLEITPTDVEASSRAAVVYECLFRLETQLRAFIDRVLTSAVGTSWIKHRVSGTIRENWKERRKKAIEDRGQDRGEVLLAFADLGDYPQIIGRGDNWPYFEPYFNRKESMVESFNRLAPLRKDIAHCRVLSPTDEIYFRVEVHRLWSAIQGIPADPDELLDQRRLP